jgi:hypothetical protein
VTRFGLPAAAVLAAVFLAIFAFVGERPRPGSEPFQPKGLLSTWSTEDVTAIRIDNGTEHHAFDRDSGGRWRTGETEVGPAVAAKIEAGLRLLKNSASERDFSPEELGGRPLAEYGLDPPRLTVAVRTAAGASATIDFGEINPLGLTQYVRMEGRRDIAMLPAYVAATWDEAIAPR